MIIPYISTISSVFSVPFNASHRFEFSTSILLEIPPQQWTRKGRQLPHGATVAVWRFNGFYGINEFYGFYGDLMGFYGDWMVFICF